MGQAHNVVQRNFCVVLRTANNTNKIVYIQLNTVYGFCGCLLF